MTDTGIGFVINSNKGMRMYYIYLFVTLREAGFRVNFPCSEPESFLHIIHVSLKSILFVIN